MNNKQRLIKEIEQAPDLLVKEVLDFLLFTKNRVREIEQTKDTDWEKQLQEMALDQEIQTEIKKIDQEFSIAEMDGLT